MRGGLREARLLEVAGGDGDRKRRVNVVVRRQRLVVDVGLLFRRNGHRLEGRGCYRLVLGEVHEREALVVATRCGFSCKDTEWRQCVRQRSHQEVPPAGLSGSSRINEALAKLCSCTSCIAFFCSNMPF